MNMEATQMDNKPLDFVIIGAQKSATTSLYKYLLEHPGIVMPKSKEAPFFNGVDVSHESLEEFNEQHFQHAQLNQLRGKASPQYMSSPDIPTRIINSMPDIKLIAILRDPVARSYSHYRMVKRRGTEKRNFAEIVREQLSSPDSQELGLGRTEAAPEHSEGYVSESEFIIAWSEYGRILENYYKLFPQNQLLVLFADELKSNPEEVISRILSFLGLEPGYVPDCLGETFHQGGDSQWLDDTTKTRLVRAPLIRGIWNKIPETKKQEIRYWFEQRNIRKQANTEEMDSDSEQSLRQHFSRDVEKLSGLVDLPPRWSEAYLKESQASQESTEV